MRRHHHHLARRQAEQARGALVHLGVGLVVAEELRGEDTIPGQPAFFAISTRSEMLPFDSVART